MIRLVLHACGVGGAPYRSSTITDQWWPFEERDVSEQEAAYLLSTFPGSFSVVQPARPSVPPAETRPATGVDRMERAPKAKAKATPKRK